MGKKEKKLYCFDIKAYNEKLTQNFNLYEELKNSLMTKKIVQDRYRQMAEADQEGEGEFISNYKIIKNNMVFGCFIHMKKGIAPEIKKTFLTKETFSLLDLEINEKEDVEGHIKDHTHFLLTKDFIILKSCRSINKESISIYLNWLLKKSKEHEGKPVIFTLPIHMHKEINLNNISAIQLNKDFKIKKENLLESLFPKNIFNYFFEATSLQNDVSKVLDTFIVFKIKKTSQDEEKLKKEALQILLSMIKDSSCTVLDKQGKPIDFDNIKASKTIRITHTDSGFPDEEELEAQMLIYLTEVINEKANRIST